MEHFREPQDNLHFPSPNREPLLNLDDATPPPMALSKANPDDGTTDRLVYDRDIEPDESSLPIPTGPQTVPAAPTPPPTERMNMREGALPGMFDASEHKEAPAVEDDTKTAAHSAEPRDVTSVEVTTAENSRQIEMCFARRPDNIIDGSSDQPHNPDKTSTPQPLPRSSLRDRLQRFADGVRRVEAQVDRGILHVLGVTPPAEPAIEPEPPKIRDSTDSTEFRSLLTEEKYFAVSADGEMFALDPISKERLRPDTIPESLLADAELKEGFDFLRNNGPQVRAELLLTRHGKAAHLLTSGIDLRAEAEDLARNDGILLLEEFSSSKLREYSEEFYAKLSAFDPERAEAYRLRTRGIPIFQIETGRQIAGTGVKIAFPDYCTDSERPADRALQQLSEQLDRFQAIHAASQTTSERNQALEGWYGTNLGYSIYRNHYLAGKTGSILARHYDANPQSTYFKLLIGLTHQPIGERLSSVGVPVRYKGIYEEGRMSASQARHISSVRRGALTLEDRVALQL